MKQMLASLILAALAFAIPGACRGAEEAESQIDESVQGALEAAGIRWANDAEGNFHVQVKCKDGRAQKLVIISGRIILGDEEEEGNDMREVYSVTLTSNDAPSAELAARLLTKNGTARLGGWAVRKNGQQFEVVYRAFIPAEACEHELLPALAMVAKYADTLEKNQTGKDEK